MGSILLEYSGELVGINLVWVKTAVFVNGEFFCFKLTVVRSWPIAPSFFGTSFVFLIVCV